MFFTLLIMKKNGILSWAKKHLFHLLIGFVVGCTLLGLLVGLGLSIEEDAPGAIVIFGGIACIFSSIVGLIWGGIAKILLDIGKKLEK
ncbi:MAG: hypothetical protein LBG59_09325 [Candidatus Peribacteria bacterium]|jgi:hypothetical protein|nr:hypothetical protein [Candidatus Peribacteria bacterium]